MGTNRITVAGRPTLLKEGTYRIAESPILVLTWKEQGSKKITRQRNEALVDVIAVLDATGNESRRPMVGKLMSRQYEAFIKLIDMVGEFSDHGYDPNSFIVHLDEHGELSMHKG